MKYLLVFFLIFSLFSCKKQAVQQSEQSEQSVNADETKPEITIKKDSMFTSFDGTRIFYKDEGVGKPILLLHGFISNGSSWYKTALVSTLKEKGYRVIILDLRGNGKSDKPENPEAYQNNAEVKDLKALVTHLGLSELQAVGYSRGSIVLAQWLTEEKRITKAVIGGMGLDFTNPEWDRRIAFADAFSGRKPLSPMTEGAVNYAKSINANIKILGLIQDYQPSPSAESLQNIKIPTLVIAGDQDIDNGKPQELKDALGNATLKIVSGDHNTTYRKAPFANEVIAFLD